MSRSITRILVAALFAASFSWIPTASAEPWGPDFDGAVKALAAMPADGVGDLFGGAGLVAAGLLGLAGDATAAIDNNTYTHVVLRGLLSTPIRRLALGTSRMSTGALEGFSNDDYEYYPQLEEHYLKVDLQRRAWTLRGGLGASLLSVVDVIGDASQFLLRLPGATGTANAVANLQNDARTTLVGPAASGAYDVGIVSLGR